MAKVQGDKAAEFAIKKAIEDINSKIVKGDGKEEDTPEKSPGTSLFSTCIHSGVFNYSTQVI